MKGYFRDSDLNDPSSKPPTDDGPSKKLELLGALVVIALIVATHFYVEVFGGERAIRWVQWLYAGDALGYLSCSDLVILSCVFLYWLLVLRHRRY